MNEIDGLICAYLLDGQGGGQEVAWPDIRNRQTNSGILWVHLDRTGAEAKRWLREDSGIGPVTCQILLDRKTHPRLLKLDNSLLIILRGVNLNPGTNPVDMVAVRILLEADRIITLRHRRLYAINDIREALSEGTGPGGPGDFLVQITHRLIERMAPIIHELDDEVDYLEEKVLTANADDLSAKLGNVRRNIIALSRYLAPQREAMANLAIEPTSWLDTLHLSRLREASDKTRNIVDYIDSARDRASVTQDEIYNRMSRETNKTIYLLTLVATVMLPLGFLTGLLGMGVGGIPGANNPWAFPIVVVGLFFVAALVIALFRFFRWF